MSGPARGRSRALGVSHSKSVLYGACVWACRVLNRQKRRYRARAGGQFFYNPSYETTYAPVPSCVSMLVTAGPYFKPTQSSDKCYINRCCRYAPVPSCVTEARPARYRPINWGKARPPRSNRVSRDVGA
jgi:hypothetical protein